MLRAFQWDLARQVERLDWMLAQLPRYADWGYNELYLHLEDAVEYPSLPGVARADALRRRELERLVRAATRAGIKVVPIVNLLGHTQYLIKTPELRDLNELRRADGSPEAAGQICPVHPRTLEVASQLVGDMAPFCTAGKVHVGLDESFHLGKHPLSREEIARVGLAGHFAGYVRRLRDLALARGLQLGIWADMLYFVPDAIPALPNDIAAYEWYYYPFKRRPKIELFGYRETDLGDRLRARGLRYWGCPMNGAFRHEPAPHFSNRLANIVAWWRRCQQLGAEGLLVTGWEPNRLALELTTVVDAAAASLWLDGVDNPREMLRRGFARVFGRRSAPAAASAAFALDHHPFGGYPRWQINTRWDTLPRIEPLSGYRAEERFFRKARERAQRERLPAPLRATLDFRWYLAFRDQWTRTLSKAHRAPTASELVAFRAAARVGLAAARAMWRRTRDASATGPNEVMVQADLRRARAASDGAAVFGPAWQLCYLVHNEAPCGQRVAVEQRSAEGAWQELQGCHTIEFRTDGTEKPGPGTRLHAAPVVWDGHPSSLPVLRFTLRGTGRVRISDVALTDGRRSIPLRLPRRNGQLGKPPPRAGLPAYAYSALSDHAPLRPEKKAGAKFAPARKQPANVR